MAGRLRSKNAAFCVCISKPAKCKKTAVPEGPRRTKKDYSIVNLLCIANIQSHSDLLSRPPCTDITSPEFYSRLSSQRTHSHRSKSRRPREGWNCRFQKNTLHGRWRQGSGSVDPRFPAGSPFLRREYHQSCAQPGFHAETKGAISGHFLLIFLCLEQERAGKKPALNPGTRVSLVKVLSNFPVPETWIFFAFRDSGLFPRLSRSFP